MKVTDLKKMFPTETATWETGCDINPLTVFENFYFYDKNGGTTGDYRRDAINRCIAEKVDFCSTDNSVYELMKKFVSVACPCGKTLSSHGGGGSSSLYHVEFRCESCGTKIVLSVPPDGLSVAFKELPRA